ncbi:hypothetical protein SLS55_003437 [Diplodia seriata]|uniref:Uncharacterized protein n=2 Tax=Diplodia seriata TaxID=420778 RepID=A0ABR3CMY7_9PEZI
MTAGSPAPRAAPTTTQYRPPAYTGTNCAIYASFLPNPSTPFVIEPNPDISGIGVLLAFIITAYATLLFTICAYWTGLVPDELLNVIDKRVFGATSRRAASPWSKAFRGALRACSDQQMVTGIAVIAAAFAGIQTVSVYHWRTVIYLGWMSSNVHLNTLTVAMTPHWNRKGRSRGATAARFVRLAGMLTLFALLVAALVPTVSQSFNNALANHPADGYYWYADIYYYAFLFTPADPIFCFWLPEYSAEGPTTDALVSLIMLTCSYAWKTTGVFFRPQQRALLRCETLRTRLPRLLRRAAMWRQRKGRFVRIMTAWPYATIVGTYAMSVAVLDFAASFFASLTMLTISLAWGTLNLLMPRQAFAEFIGPDENTWNFGQVLPMLLLLLPVVSVVEEFSVATHHEEGQGEAVSHPKSHYSPNWAKETPKATTGLTRPRAETFELPLLSHRRTQSSSAAASASRTGTATTSSSSSSTAKHRFPPHHTHADELYSADKIASPTSIREVSSWRSDLEGNGQDVGQEGTEEGEKTKREADDELLCSSRFFRSLVWLTLVGIVLATVWVFVMQSFNVANGLGEDQVVFNAGLASVVVTALMLIWIAVGSSFSSVDKLL